jgi:hypothetical protein
MDKITYDKHEEKVLKIFKNLDIIHTAIETFGKETMINVAKARLKGNKDLWNRFFYPPKNIKEVELVIKVAEKV